MDNETKKAINDGFELEKMCKTEGWNIFVSRIKEVVSQLREDIVGSMPEDFQKFCTYIMERKGRLAAYEDIVSFVGSSIEEAHNLDKIEQKGGDKE